LFRSSRRAAGAGAENFSRQFGSTFVKICLSPQGVVTCVGKRVRDLFGGRTGAWIIGSGAGLGLTKTKASAVLPHA